MNPTTLRTLDDVRAVMRKSPDDHYPNIGSFLLEQGFISRHDLEQALEQQTQFPDKRLGNILIERGLINEFTVILSLCNQFDIPFVKLAEFQPDREIMGLIEPSVAIQHRVLPLAKVGDQLVVATDNPIDHKKLDLIRFHTDTEIIPLLAESAEIDGKLRGQSEKISENQALEGLNQQGRSAILAGIADDEVELSALNSDQPSELGANSAPIVRLVEALLIDAVTSNTSDINIRPSRKTFDVYFRQNGKMVHHRSMPISLLPAVVNRFKILGRMDIAERRRPQDGRARVRRGGHVLDLRISVIPTVRGESIVLRLLDQAAGVKPIDQLGLSPENLARVREAISHPHGIFLVTGPTGSGKSTTLYAILNELRKGDPHIITVEDPVEYQIDGFEQIQVSHRTGYTFAQALRQILRHDPDIIMVGEIRDSETAEIALRAALTGHLVLSTLHTNDASAAITRLIDMGIAPYLLSSSLIGVVAQRLLRLNCPHCLEPETVDEAVRIALNLDPEQPFFRSRGCPRCNNTGVSGRIAVNEVLLNRPDIAQMITKGVEDRAIKTIAVENTGMVPLTQTAIQVAIEGRAAISEVFNIRLEI